MIVTKDMYDLFIHKVHIEMMDIEKEVESLANAKQYFLENLRRFDNYIRNHVDIIYNRLEKVTDKKVLYSTVDPAVKTYMLGLIEVNLRTEFLSKRMIILKQCDISWKEYTFIIREFNKKVCEKIIDTAYRFKIIGLGTIKIITRYRKENSKKKYIHWGDTNKKKEAILLRGGVPFETIKNEVGEVIGDNGGEDYLVFAETPYVIFWKWYKEGTRLVHNDLYKFLETTGPNGNRERLQEVVRGNKLAYLKYDE